MIKTCINCGEAFKARRISHCVCSPKCRSRSRYRKDPTYRAWVLDYQKRNRDKIRAQDRRRYQLNLETKRAQCRARQKMDRAMAAAMRELLNMEKTHDLH